MKITLASCQNKYCGIGQYTQNLALAFKSLGHQPLVYRKDDEELPIFNAYPYRSFRKLRPYIAPYYLSRSLRETNGDILQADYVDAAFGTILAKKTDNLYVTIHDAIPFVYSSSQLDFNIYKYELAQTIKKAKAVITVSEHARQEVLKYTSASPNLVFAVHNGIDHTRFFADGPKKKNEIFTIKYLGGLGVPHKNAKALLQTAQILQDKNIKFRMEIGGYLPENHHLRVFAKEQKLENVHFAGFVEEEDMAPFYQSADIFLFPSLLEGFGFPPLESMACGTPVVVSDIPVLKEILGEAAIYANPKPESYAEAIINYLNNPQLWLEKSAQSKEKASTYTWKKTAEKMLEIYERQ